MESFQIIITASNAPGSTQGDGVKTILTITSREIYQEHPTVPEWRHLLYKGDRPFIVEELIHGITRSVKSRLERKPKVLLDLSNSRVSVRVMLDDYYTVVEIYVKEVMFRIEKNKKIDKMAQQIHELTHDRELACLTAQECATLKSQVQSLQTELEHEKKVTEEYARDLQEQQDKYARDLQARENRQAILDAM
jgi:hypothetical protein